MNFNRYLDSAIDLWLEEDIGEGDHTTLSTIPPEAEGKAKLIVKQTGILAGIEIVERIFSKFDESLNLQAYLSDGSRISPGQIAFHVSGEIQSILQCERLVLNVLQRMSGIATITNEYVKLIEGTGSQLLDTRKTTPGFRMLEKEAVRIGGGYNHRTGLYDMILIKDNHIDFSGGIEQAVARTRNYLISHNLDLKIEIEARTFSDIEKILQIGQVDRILLDNFTPEETRKAVILINKEFETEASGGITRDNIRSYAECGVDFISVGALTHQVKSLDMSLKSEF